MLFGALNSSELEQLGIPPSARVEVIPQNESFFYLRMENLQDNFELIRQKNYFVNIEKLKDHIISKVYSGKALHRDSQS